MRPQRILSALALAVLAIWSAVFYFESGVADATASSMPLIAAVEERFGLPVGTVSASGLEESPALKKILAAYAGKPLALDVRTQTTGCAVRGPLPDSRCTPGAVFEVSTTTICTAGYSRSVRNVSVKTKRQVYAEYGLSYPQASGAFEVDHLIPLELGGSNDVANLFPEAAEPTPGFHEKDLVENYLHDEVCDGVIGLSAAQEQIARDWLAVYDTLTPATIAALKHQVASYNN